MITTIVGPVLRFVRALNRCLTFLHRLQESCFANTSSHCAERYVELFLIGIVVYQYNFDFFQLFFINFLLKID